VDLEPHKQIGPYRLLSKIGDGRSCEVWEAIDDIEQLRRALKVLRPAYAKDRNQVDLLKQEFAVGRGLNHPQVIHIYDFRVLRGTVFLAMEVFRSHNLKEWLHDQKIDGIAPFASRIFEQTAIALGYLHSQGWIHRDVKPDNFLMNREGTVKLIDFAIAEKSKGTLGKFFAGRSKIQGTRSYMSPEQIRGRGVDARSDIYGLGCMFHELIAGKPPFTGQNTQELLTKHLQNPPPPLESTGRDVTSEFAELVRKMLAKDPAQRPQSMNDVLKALKNLKVFIRMPQPPKPESASQS
jgi:eukaryotic-like serine/threonine-protein kinase